MGRDETVGSGVIVAGIGCRSGCAPEAIVRLVREAARRAGVAPTLLAVPCFKAAEPGVLDAARQLALALRSVDRAAMQDAQPRCATRSQAALRATGLACVAEAAALSAAGPGAALLLPRIAGDGATCALAAAA